MRISIPLLSSVALLAGCASTPRFNFQDVSYPPINQTSTAYLGDRLMMQGRGFQTDIVDVSTLRGKYAIIGEGAYCRVPGTDTFFNFGSRPIVFLNFLGGSRGSTNKFTYKPATNEVCLDDMWSGCFGSEFGSIKYRSDAVCSDPNAQQKIIEYNGKAGEVLNFTYREYFGSRMNAPVTTNFTMDQSEGDVIIYKGARMKVIRATNQEIEYVVLKNFNDAR
ncbi:hypothetical protein [Nitrogeniibacter aestuarii]|uniref:hypothetical protein n=1 Tax=Nitrogeniibacter aestuarii TaxID=2815343 RepID=UPI001D1253F7|nr:hypothetical protein [Nitrogeniibacter aestuarii]